MAKGTVRRKKAKQKIDRDRLVCLTPEGRVTFVHVFEPYAFEEGDEPSYQAIMVFDEDTDISALEDCIAYAASLIDEDWEELVEDGKFNIPIRKCREYKQHGEPFTDNPDAPFIRVHSKDKFPVVDENVDDIINKKQFYSGCYARAYIYAHGYSNKNTGVTLFCNGMQKTRDGEPLAGGAGIDPKAVFAPIGGKKKKGTFGNGASSGLTKVKTKILKPKVRTANRDMFS